METSTAGFFRIISPIRKKGTISFIGVGGNGTEYHYELQRRDLKNLKKQKLLFLERGDILRLRVIGLKDLSLIRVPKTRELIIRS